MSINNILRTILALTLLVSLSFADAATQGERPTKKRNLRAGYVGFADDSRDDSRDEAPDLQRPDPTVSGYVKYPTHPDRPIDEPTGYVIYDRKHIAPTPFYATNVKCLLHRKSRGHGDYWSCDKLSELNGDVRKIVAHKVDTEDIVKVAFNIQDYITQEGAESGVSQMIISEVGISPQHGLTIPHYARVKIINNPEDEEDER